MNKKIKGIALVSALVASFAMSASASSEIRDITAQVNNELKIKVDNVEWDPYEENGTIITPIIHNGRTYLPVRALCDILGVAVDWDEEQQLISIGNKEWTPLKAKMAKGFRNIGYTTDKEQLYTGKCTYEFGLVVDKDNITQGGWQAIEVLTDGAYQTMKLTGFVSGGDKVITIRDIYTGEVYKVLELKDGVAVDTEFEIKGAEKIEICWDNNKADKLIFGDIYLK